MKSDRRALLAELESIGWRMRRCRRGHFVMEHPQSGAIMTLGCTPSDVRTHLNVRTTARRAIREALARQSRDVSLQP